MSDVNGTGPVSGSPSDLRQAFEIGAKLLVVLTVVSILCLGLIGCTMFFIYMCFVHPDAANTILPLIIPAAMTTMVGVYGKKAVAILSGNKDKVDVKSDK